MYRETLHDLHVNYSNTHVGVQLPGGLILPAYIEEITDNEGNPEGDDWEGEHADPDSVYAEESIFQVRVWPIVEKPDEAIVMELKLDELVLRYPSRLGVIEVGDMAIFGARVAKVEGTSKYRRTITYESIEFHNPNLPECFDLKRDEPKSMYPEYLYKAFNGISYRNLEEAIELLLAGERMGCALSSKYSIHISADHEFLNIAREGYVIGVYKPESSKVYLNNEELRVFTEELGELGASVSDELFKKSAKKKSEGISTTSTALYGQGGVDNWIHEVDMPDAPDQVFMHLPEDVEQAIANFTVEAFMEEDQ